VEHQLVAGRLAEAVGSAIDDHSGAPIERQAPSGCEYGGQAGVIHYREVPAFTGVRNMPHLTVLLYRAGVP
jgi:hypothetical protein